MSEWHIGVIGGSGLYDVGELEEAQEIPVASAFGEPSGPVTTGRIGAVRFTFIARHGADHRLSPSTINYRANIDVLKRCGVSDVLAISAIGSLKEELAPGTFVAIDQLIDRTLTRERSFFGDGIAAHVSLADPVCPRLSGLVAALMLPSRGRSSRPGPKAASTRAGGRTLLA
jgi:5'-methylthioadenosine phosphorylase